MAPHPAKGVSCSIFVSGFGGNPGQSEVLDIKLYLFSSSLNSSSISVI
jgi:hypothetical protein